MGSYPTVSPLPFGYKGGLFSVALFRRLTAPRRYLAVCPVELGLSSMGPKQPTATIGPTTSRASTYRAAGVSGKPYRVTRLMRRAMLSGGARSSQKPLCSPKTTGRSRFHPLGTNVLRSGSRRSAEIA